MKNTSSQDVTNLVTLLLISTLVRIYAIQHPNQVVFDEVHFGSYASRYIKGEFFFDVHPPLGKLLIAAFGAWYGYDGQFQFDRIGSTYTGEWYVGMRMAAAVFGVMLVPAVYLLLRACKFGGLASMVGAFMVLFDNALVGQSRFMLVDAFLLLFTVLAAYAWTHVTSSKGDHSPLLWLIATGVFMGCTMSTKLTGFIVIAFIGASAIKNLWEIIDDLTVDVGAFLYHAAVRVACLVVLPFMLYLYCFHVHFSIAAKHTTDADRFSMEFQSALKDNPVQVSTPTDIMYGSTIALRHVHTFRGYLHSHGHAYPTGSQQQQVTGYPLNDDNSKWLVMRDNNNITGLEYVRHGDIIRLLHVGTQKRLHSHDNKPPLADGEKHKEVTAYGVEGFEGDTNDNWRVDIYDYNPHVPESKDRLMAVHSVFRLIHVNQRCALFAFTNTLPKWGYGQQEITCMQSPMPKHTLWRVDDNQHSGLPINASRASYRKLSFLERFWEVFTRMVSANSDLTRAHPYESRPTSWLTLKRGVSYWSGEHGQQIYLLGNPLVWLLSTASLGVWFVFQCSRMVLVQRHFKFSMFNPEHPMNSAGGYFAMGWITHWVPFLFMQRQLFIHHYLPALVFGILMTATIVESLGRVSQRLTKLVAIVLMVSLALSFAVFSPWTYGSGKSDMACRALKVRSTWDWKCHDGSVVEQVQRKDSPQQEKLLEGVEVVEESGEDVSIPDPADAVLPVIENAVPVLGVPVLVEEKPEPVVQDLRELPTDEAKLAQVAEKAEAPPLPEVEKETKVEEKEVEPEKAEAPTLPEVAKEES